MSSKKDKSKLFSLSRKTKSNIETKKISIRFPSGKIYGPYTRIEIIDFLQKRQLKGNEEILYFGDSEWIPLSADVELFDWLKRRLDRKNLEFEITEHTKKAPQTVATKRIDVKTQKKEVVESNKEAKKKKKPKKPLVNKEKQSIDEPSIQYVNPNDLAETPNVDWHSIEESKLQKAANALKKPATAKKNKAMWPVLLVFGIAILGIMFSGEDGISLPFGNDDNIEFKSAYFKPISILTKKALIRPPTPPINKKLSAGIRFAENRGFGAEHWFGRLEDLQQNISNPEKANRLDFWYSWAWNLLWAASTLESSNKHQAEVFYKGSEKIYSSIQENLSDEWKTMYLSAQNILLGNWALAYNDLAVVTEEQGQWLRQLCFWMDFWQNGAKSQLSPLDRKNYRNSYLFASTSIMHAFLQKDSQFVNGLIQLVEIQARSPLLWWMAAEWQWRVAGANVQLSNKFFVVGLATLSLWPRVMQSVMWGEYTRFLSTYGRQQTSEQSMQNTKLLNDNDSTSAFKDRWWDLDDKSFNLSLIAEDSFKKIEQQGVLSEELNVIKPRDIAILQVLGYVLDGKERYLNEVGYHFAFLQDWDKARELFQEAHILNENNLDAVGGILWTYARQFQFDNAFNVLDEIERNRSWARQAQKYRAVIFANGRDYKSAMTSFNEYIRSDPLDGWGHYYKAIMLFETEDYMNCIKSANIAMLNASGQLKLRSKLLLLRARVKSGYQKRTALKELKSLAQTYPQNIAITENYVRALADANRLRDAIIHAAKVKEQFPRSYEVRILLGDLFSQKKEFDKAILLYQRAGKERPNNAISYIKIARIFEEQLKYKQAAQNFLTAGSKDPSYPEVWLFAARMYRKANQVKKAAQMYAKELESRPSVLSTFVEAAEFLLENHAPQEVPKLFQQFSESFHDDPRVMVLLAKAYLALENFSQAKSAAEIVLGVDDGNAEAHRVMAYSFDKLGNYPIAKHHFKKYLKLYPVAPDANFIEKKLSESPYSY